MLTFAFMHYPYLVRTLFGMPSLHLFTFSMFFKSCCTCERRMVYLLSPIPSLILLSPPSRTFPPPALPLHTHSPPPPHTHSPPPPPHTHTRTHTEGLQVGNLDLANCDMNVILLQDITTDPNASIVSDTCHMTVYTYH